MIKFRGIHSRIGLHTEGDLVHEYVGEEQYYTKIRDKIGMPDPIKPDTLEINVSGHWLKVEDLEAIVEKVMGGKDDC